MLFATKTHPQVFGNKGTKLHITAKNFASTSEMISQQAASRTNNNELPLNHILIQFSKHARTCNMNDGIKLRF